MRECPQYPPEYLPMSVGQNGDFKLRERDIEDALFSAVERGTMRPIRQLSLGSAGRADMVCVFLIGEGRKRRWRYRVVELKRGLVDTAALVQIQRYMGALTIRLKEKHGGSRHMGMRWIVDGLLVGSNIANDVICALSGPAGHHVRFIRASFGVAFTPWDARWMDVEGVSGSLTPEYRRLPEYDQ